MSKILSLFLVITLLLSSVSFSVSCKETGIESGVHENPPPTKSEDESEDKGESDGKITVPTYKDFGRGTVDFKSIVYSRPDCDKIISKIKEVTDLIEKGGNSFETELSLVVALEEDYELFLTMHSYASLMNSIDSSDRVSRDEFLYLNGKYPSFTKAVEDMMVAAARSEHSLLFETEYFGDGFVSKYKDGGIYTDKVILLMEKENALEGSYSSLSPTSVIIEYDGKVDTYENITGSLEGKYGKDTEKYASALSVCRELYENAVKEKSVDIMVELFKVRREISDELEYDSYAHLAYTEIGHDYTEKELFAFLTDVKNYIIPLYSYLEYFVFLQFFAENDVSFDTSKSSIINNSYEQVKNLDSEISEIYAYMLQHELYNIEEESVKRFDGSFTTYFESYEAPFLFVTLRGNADDYFTLSHEFGHFADAFFNYGASASLELCEISSTAFEWLMLDGIDSVLSKEDARYLKYLKFRSSLEAIISQSFYALFEHYAYSLDAERISENTLKMALGRAAKEMGLDHAKISSLEYATIPHIMLYPFYVESYAVSEMTSLGIYFMEEKRDGDGLEAYKDLIKRDEGLLGFEEELSDAGIESPFEKGFVKKIADAIHYKLIGAHYDVKINGNQK